MTDYNTVIYNIPKCTEMMFCIPPLERDFSIRLLDGSVQLLTDPTTIHLPLHQEYHLSGLQCLSSVLSSRSKSILMFRGNHYVIYAKTKRGDTSKNLLAVSMNGESFVFVLQKEAQLKVLVGDENSRIKLQAIRGLPGIFGSSLIQGKRYRLRPNTSITINSLNDKMYTVSIEGKNRTVSISLQQDESWDFMTHLHSRIYALRMNAMANKCTGPTVLVLGQKNVGKTAFCHYLLNKAVDDGMNPIYIDLEVRGNANAIPGTISLTEIKGHCHVTKGFPRHVQNILQFGDVNINNANKNLYHHLIRRMGELLEICQTDNITHYSGTVIDMCGFLCEDNSTILCILESFKIDLVVFVGDRRYYDALQNSVLETIKSEFIPRPQNIEPRDEINDIKHGQITLRKYFYGKIRKPIEVDVCQVKFSSVHIYRIVSLISDSSTTNTMKDFNGFRVERVACAPSIENHVLGVSLASSIEYSPSIEVKFFICFKKVDMKKETVSFLSPEPNILPKILIMGNIKMI